MTSPENVKFLTGVQRVTKPTPVPRAAVPVSGACFAGARSLGPRLWLYRLRCGRERFVRRLHSYYGGVNFSPTLHRRLRLLPAPMRTDGCCRMLDREISRFPCMERLHMPGSLITPIRPGACDHAPACVAFRQMHGVGTQNRILSQLDGWLCARLSTLRRNPRGQLRMARGRCGSLLLHRKRLALSAPCRSPGASHRYSARLRPQTCGGFIRNDGFVPRS